jgi:hypothetical protein
MALPRTPMLDIEFGLLTPKEYVGQGRWRCECKCGGEITANGKNIRKGRTGSCGCVRRKCAGALRRTHGLSHTPEHRSYKAMMARCYCVTHKNYDRYGGRGITVCRRWRGPSGFEHFLVDMTTRPPGLTLERKNNNKPYSPGNCEWATRKKQARNTIRNKFVRLGRVTKSLAEWCEQRNLNYHRVVLRLLRGWTKQEALELEPRKRPHVARNSVSSMEGSARTN